MSSYESAVSTVSDDNNINERLNALDINGSGSFSENENIETSSKNDGSIVSS